MQLLMAASAFILGRRC